MESRACSCSAWTSPIRIHGGRGLPPIADNLARLVETYPAAQLIIAHGGIADLAALAEFFAGKAGVFFDTSVWSPVDLLDVYRHFSPEQILFASDYPYGQQPASLLIAIRTAKAFGLALNACNERNGRVPEEIDRIKELISTARDLWRIAPEGDDEQVRRQLSRTTFRLIHLADIWAVTPGV